MKVGGSTKMDLDVPRAGETEEEAAKMRKAVRAREKFMRGLVSPMSLTLVEALHKF